MKKNLFRVLAILFLSSHTFANSQINSEFRLQLPRNFVESLIERKWQVLTDEEFQSSWSIPNQTVQADEVPVQVRNIILNVKTQLEKPELQPDENILRLSSQNLEAQLLLGEVEIDHIVEREVGGVIGKFRVQALCKNVILNLDRNEGSLSVDLEPLIGQREISTRLVNHQLSWTGQWSSPGFTCTGAKGFEELVQSEIRKVAQDWRTFLAPHQDRIASYLQSAFEEFRLDFSQTVQFPFSDLKGVTVAMDFSQISSEKTAFVIDGHLQIRMKQGAGRFNLKLSGREQAAGSGSTASLLLPRDLVKTLLNQYFTKGGWNLRIQSKAIQPFQEFMKARIAQAFVWPDLLNFHQGTNFIFDLFSSRPMRWEGSGFDYQVSGTISAWMQAPKDGAYRRFMFFHLPFQAESSIQVERGQARVHVQRAQVGLKPYWDQEYIKAYGAHQTMNEQRIGKELNQYLINNPRTFSFALPDIRIADGVKLRVTRARTSASNLKLSLEVR